MKITDVTPEWIGQVRDALGLQDVDIYTAVGMPQDFFSKSMNGKRRFKPAELVAVLEFLTGPDAGAHLPVVTEIRARLPLLGEADQQRILSLIERLSAEAPGSSPTPQGDHSS